MIPVAIGLIEGFRAFGWLTEDHLGLPLSRTGNLGGRVSVLSLPRWDLRFGLDIYPARGDGITFPSHWGHSVLRASESAQLLPTYRRLACDPPLVRPGSSFLFRELTSVIT